MPGDERPEVHEVQCTRCQQHFRDDDALRQHGLREHFQTRQQNEQEHADAVMQQAQQTAVRQQDAAGRRETAGQPSDPVPPIGEEAARQQTQQQQRQIP